MDARQAEAEQRYITSEITLRQLSEETGIPFATIGRWSKQGAWTKKREKIQRRAMRKAATRAVDKKARELEKLLLASGAAENALLMAMEQFAKRIEEDPEGEMLVDGRFRAGNLSQVVHALGRQAETRMLLSGILAQADREKLELLKRKQALEEKKALEEQTAGSAEVRVILSPEVEDMLDGENRGDTDAAAEPAAGAVPAEP